jgi:hypothetical protein
MLETTPSRETASANADARPRAKRKPTATRTVTSGPIQEPGSDWVPPTRAPFYYCSRGYIRSPEEWERRLRELVTPFGPSPWSLERFENSRTIEISSMGLRTHISPEHGIVGIGVEQWTEVPLFVGTVSEFLRDEGRWVKYRPELKSQANWHRESLRTVLYQSAEWLTL